MKLPEIVTFASTQEQLRVALSAGADHIVLEDSKLSLRSYSDDFSVPHFEKLIQLAETAREINPEVRLSFNADILIHHEHFVRLDVLVPVLKRAGIRIVRVQDPGLISYFADVFPEAEVHFSSETGNQNLESIRFFRGQCRRQILSAEMPHTELAKVTAQIPGEFEIQVHGPLLIQYSRRRFQAGSQSHLGLLDEDPVGAIAPRLAQDQEYPGRFFPVYDTPHGHLMYLYFDRYILPHLPKLMAIGLTAWLVDGRGESLDYLRAAVAAYKTEALRYSQNPSEWQLDTELVSALKSVARRPLKSGFFTANKTDFIVKGKQHQLLREEGNTLGVVIDIVKNKWMTVELSAPISNGQSLQIMTPEHHAIPYTVTQIHSLTNKVLEQADPPALVKLKWQKGVCTQSLLIAPAVS